MTKNAQNAPAAPGFNYTKEPWEEFCEVCEPSTPHPDSEPIVRIGFADYRRARLCVNALAHITTEELESGRLQNLVLRCADTEKQRDDLLAALEAGHSSLHILPGGKDCKCSQCEFVRLRRSAIASVKGGA